MTIFDRQEFLDTIRSVRASSRLLCAGFQRDISALLDGELPEEHSKRALAHMESCPACAEFFKAIRLQALAHRDVSVPGSLSRRLRRLRGEELFEGLTDAEIVRRLARALYQLGKAYVRTATRHDYLVEISEQPVEIDRFQEGEMAEAAEVARQSGACRVPVEVLEARSAGHLELGHRLLSEALALKPAYTEARLWLGFSHQARGQAKEAAEVYRRVFLETERLVNRAFAAIQLGMLYHDANEPRRALRAYRWVLASGLLGRRRGFTYVLYNLAVEHWRLGDRASTAAMLRRIRTRHPDYWPEVRPLLELSPEFLSELQKDPACRRELVGLMTANPAGKEA